MPDFPLAEQWVRNAQDGFDVYREPNGGGGGGTPANTVADLDGTGDAGASSDYSRGDHKHADVNRPATGEKAALAGTSGVPSALNKYVTDADARNTNARTPTAHTHPESEVVNLVGDLATLAAAITTKAPSSRNLTAGAGLTGGGDLSADRTFAVGAGTGITVNADDVAVQYGTTAGTAAQGNDARLSDARTPTAHATSHQDGGTDEISVTGLSGLLADTQHPIIGALATEAVAGNDARLTDSRTPLAHAASHAALGSDPLTLSESQVTNLTADLAAKALATRQIISGAGLTGGGDLSADRTLAVGAGTGITVNADDIAVQYGTSGTTACVGNDSRLSDSRVAASIPDDTAAAGDILFTAKAAPATPAAGKGKVYVDSTSKNIAVKDDAGVVKHGVQTQAATSNQFVTAISDAGVVSQAQPTEADLSLSDITTNNVTSTKHGLAPKSPADATKFLNGAATNAYAQVKDSDLSLSDITTNDVSTTKHGLAPKAPNDATKFLDGTGAYSVPASGSGLDLLQIEAMF
jgi:hypothetical protein